jgi:hypothetical protein
VTRGLGTVGCACPACEHSTVAPTCNKKPGILHHYQSAVVDGHGWADHYNGRAFAV